MVGIHGIGYVPRAAGLANTEPSASAKDGVRTTAPQDALTLSGEARGAAHAAAVLSQQTTFSEIEARRLEEARQEIAQGAHRVVETVRIVAARISPYV